MANASIRKTVAFTTAAVFMLASCSTQMSDLTSKKTCDNFTSSSLFVNCVISATPVDQAATGDHKATISELHRKLTIIRSDASANRISEEVALSRARAAIDEAKSRELDTNIENGLLGALAVGAIALGVYAASKSGGGGGRNSFSGASYSRPQMCSAAGAYAKPRCLQGKACGDTCIQASDTCHVGRGSACNLQFRTYP